MGSRDTHNIYEHMQHINDDDNRQESFAIIELKKIWLETQQQTPVDDLWLVLYVPEIKDTP